MKRTLSLILSLLMVLSLFAELNAGAQDVIARSVSDAAIPQSGDADLADTGGDDTVYTSGDYQYKILDDGTAKIVKSSSGLVPSSVDGKTVTVIGESAFCGRDIGTSLLIPDSIVRIEKRAFNNCRDLKNVTLPETLEYIGEDAFTWTNIDQVYIPRNTVLDYNEDMAFSSMMGKTSLKTDGRPFSSYYDFKDKSYAKSYRGDSWLISEEFTEPDCERRHLPAVDYICMDQPDGTVHIRNATTFVNQAAEFTVPTTINGKKVSGIESGAFHVDRNGWMDARRLYEIKNGYLIGNTYFDANGNIKYYTYSTDKYFGNKTLNITLDGDAAVESDTCYGNVKLHITGEKDIPEGNFANQQHLTELTIEDGVTNIGAHAFENCSDLKSVTIAKSVKSIGQNAFGYYGYNLKVNDFTVYGYRRTAAERYANENGFNFVNIGGDAFDLYFAGVQINYDNCDAIPVSSGSANYDPVENILYLNSAVVDTGEKTAQGATFGIDGMKVIVTGNCKIIGGTVNGIKLKKSVTITGSGTLTVSGKDCGISMEGGDDGIIKLTVDHTVLNVSGKYGINGGSIPKNKYFEAIASNVTVNGTDSAVNYLGEIKLKADKITVPNNAVIKSTATWDGSPSLGVYDGDSLALNVVIEKQDFRLSGSFTSYLNTAGITLELLQDGSQVDSAAYQDDKGTYSFTGVASGTYTLRVSKKNHVTRDYKVTVSGNTTQDVKICPIGDADNNGRVNAADAKAAFQHGNEQKLIDDEYKQKCAEVASPKNRINSADAKAIFQHANEQKSLWTE